MSEPHLLWDSALEAVKAAGYISPEEHQAKCLDCAKKNEVAGWAIYEAAVKQERERVGNLIPEITADVCFTCNWDICDGCVLYAFLAAWCAASVQELEEVSDVP